MPISTKELVQLAEDLTEQQLKDLQATWLDKNKEKLTAELKAKKVALRKKINDAKKVLSGLESELAELTGKKTKGKRDTGLKDAVLTFLKEKGKDGAHVNDIAAHIGKPKVNINAFLSSTGKKHGVKRKGTRTGIYFLAK